MEIDSRALKALADASVRSVVLALERLGAMPAPALAESESI